MFCGEREGEGRIVIFDHGEFGITGHEKWNRGESKQSTEWTRYVGAKNRREPEIRDRDAPTCTQVGSLSLEKVQHASVPRSR